MQTIHQDNIAFHIEQNVGPRWRCVGGADTYADAQAVAEMIAARSGAPVRIVDTNRIEWPIK